MELSIEKSPFRVLMPDGLEGLIEVVFEYPGLRMAVVERDLAGKLDRSWQAAGVYFLLDRPDALGRWGAYVGMAAPGDLRARLRSHLHKREHWYRAVLVRRNSSDDGFHTGQAGWLEGHLYDILAGADTVRLNNRNRPRDLTISAHDQASMRIYIPPILACLRLLGHELSHRELVDDVPTPPAPEPAKSEPVAKRRSSIEVSDLLSAELLSPGAALIPKSRKHTERAAINADGTIRFREKNWPTLSGPARALTGHQQNGWEFWRVDTPEGSLPISALRDRLERQRDAGV
ncbi:hypothetical protein [Spongiactinospora sp. TRM90649]|uniref:restriction system modified-DNA reader domain-containing protein n=1 Tax=Spongiactinospora sp. TRM90649 TaxID=3031114 RepID=UPI0023F8E215|nr:hypothetical protein [Spongiactinospora sp. TRM90649]MDF5758795.1 hypothetical protein [Spongiactinospora sp. TRM90649]